MIAPLAKFIDWYVLQAAVLVHPCRLAVTGKTSGPSLYHLLQVLGKERVMVRIEKALATIA